jgi:hypothetical protein
MLRHQNTTEIRYRNNKTFAFPGEVNADMFQNRDQRSLSQVEREYNASKNTLREYQSDDTKKFAEIRQAEVTNFKNLSSRLCKDTLNWYYFGRKESDEMVQLKMKLNYLNNLLDQGVNAFVVDGVLDIPRMQKAITTAYDEVISACEFYIEQKKVKNQGKKGGGIRRLKLVDEVLKSCRTEKFRYVSLAEAVKTKTLEDYNSLEDIKDMTPRELTTKHLDVVADTAEFQNEGNSTDVYKITVQNGEKTYYIKENLPLISDDVEGFINRRLDQLKASRQAKAENRENDEENRLKKNELSLEEYDKAILLFEALKKRIDNADTRDKASVRKKVLAVFSHDFDTMFKELAGNNYAAEYINEKGVGENNWAKIAEDTTHPLRFAAKFILEYQNKQKLAEQAGQAGQAGQEVQPPEIREKTAKEWIVEKLGLNARDDKDIIDILDKMMPALNKQATDQEKEDAKHKQNKAIERMFTVSTGKEVELYGQIKARTGVSADGEIAAAKNTATCELAKTMGFTDVVTMSDTRVVKFKDRTGKTRSAYCTVCEAAKGDEFINVIKEAERDKKTIHYTPQAMKQLMRLQAFDTVCLQVDRHGRNFKCDVDRSKEGKLIIKSIKSYDHDMSFGDEDIDTLLKGNSVGFLPGMNKNVKKGTPLYNYINKKYFGTGVSKWIKDIKAPILHTSNGERNDERLINGFKDLILILPWHGEINVQDQTLGYGKVDGNIYKRDHDQDNKISYNEFLFKRDTKSQLLDQDNEDQKIEREQVYEKLQGILKELKEVAVEKKNVRYGLALKLGLKLDEKKKILKLVKDLKELNDKYDFRYLKVNYGLIWHDGLLDYSIQNIISTYTNLFMEDPEMVDEISDKKYTKEQKDERRQARARLTAQDGSLNIPSLLHYDYEAYLNIKKLAEGETEQLVKGQMKGLDFSDKKIAAIKKRCIQMKAEIEDAQKRAEAFFKLAGWDETTARGRFFLKSDKDYEEIGNLSEMAVDPGSTYLSIDNENYLFGEKEFADANNKVDVSKAMGMELKKRRDPKRWNDQDYLSHMTEESAAQFMNNALKGKIEKV